MGYAAVGAGELNNDGYDDLALGGPEYGGSRGWIRFKFSEAE